MLKNVCVMGFDFGESRIGVAVGNTLLKIPHPLIIITGKNKFEKLEKIRQLVDKWKPGLFVVGMPQAEDHQDYSEKLALGRKSNSQNKNKEKLINNIRKFANRLKHSFNLEVKLVSEDFTSSDAAIKLKEQSVHGIKQKGKLDALAACGILEQYFASV